MAGSLRPRDPGVRAGRSHAVHQPAATGKFCPWRQKLAETLRANSFAVGSGSSDPAVLLPKR